MVPTSISATALPVLGVTPKGFGPAEKFWLYCIETG